MARVSSENDQRCEQINAGLVLLVGFHPDDTPERIERLARKILSMRVFDDEAGKMNLCVSDVNGELLVVPNFTLASSIKKGRRPCFDTACDPLQAKELFQCICTRLEAQATVAVRKGFFGAHMDVLIKNDGPVTFIIDTCDM